MRMTFKSTDFQPLIDQADLEDGVQETSRLLLIDPIVINGVPHHLEAIELRDGDGANGEMDVVQVDGNDAAINAYYDLNADAPRTVEIEGLPDRRYFLMIYPHAY